MATWNELIHSHKIPAMVGKLLYERHLCKKRGIYTEADSVRRSLEEIGFTISDTLGAYVAFHPTLTVTLHVQEHPDHS